MPIVPHIDIEGFGPAEDEHDQINAEGNNEYERTDDCAERDGSRHTPADIQRVKLNPGRFDQCGSGWSKRVEQQRDDQSKTDEANADCNGGNEGAADFLSQDEPQDKDDDRQHDRRTKPGQEVEDRLDGFHMHSPFVIGYTSFLLQKHLYLFDDLLYADSGQEWNPIHDRNVNIIGHLRGGDHQVGIGRKRRHLWDTTLNGVDPQTALFQQFLDLDGDMRGSRDGCAACNNDLVNLSGGTIARHKSVPFE